MDINSIFWLVLSLFLLVAVKVATACGVQEKTRKVLNAFGDFLWCMLMVALGNAIMALLNIESWLGILGIYFASGFVVMGIRVMLERKK